MAGKPARAVAVLGTYWGSSSKPLIVHLISERTQQGVVYKVSHLNLARSSDSNTVRMPLARPTMECHVASFKAFASPRRRTVHVNNDKTERQGTPLRTPHCTSAVPAASDMTACQSAKEVAPDFCASFKSRQHRSRSLLIGTESLSLDRRLRRANDECS
jgi:hypothetical protein